MNIIKLSAINSTNDYLKELSATRHMENFTVVIADTQTAGRGQMGSQWNAEAGKNLTFSVLVKDLLLDINEIFTLNAAVATGIAASLSSLNVPSVSIKWPNDILAGNKKIGGVLIENSIKRDGEIFSVIGIGLNVNQTQFDNLPKASSIALATGREFDRDAVLITLLDNLKPAIARILHKDTRMIWHDYHRQLYRKGIPSPFEKDGRQFMGIIKGVTQSGTLEVQMEDDSVSGFGVKEVQLLY
jgi:BirA family transcriptional regulator, biotin operon repressor / biotin---[acetyl-CoA-carboxylase] ligase